MRVGSFHDVPVFAVVALVVLDGCSRKELPVTDVSPGSGGRFPAEGGAGAAQGTGGVAVVGGSSAAGGGATVLVQPTGPLLHPPPGFEDCVHAEVKEDCENGWCKLPPSCVVIGSPIDAWHHGRLTEIQTEVTLTHMIEVQQKEFSIAEWESLLGTEVTGVIEVDDGECAEGDCPRNNVTWWEAVHVANVLSEREGLDPCYEPVNCEGQLGTGRSCDGVTKPDNSVYDCEGYRLPTWAEAEYSARAGTISDFYSGTVTVYDDEHCLFDVNLAKVAWYCDNSGNRAHRCGEKQMNGFGLYDKLGNLGEWANEEDRSGPATGGADPSGKVGTSQERLIHGGMYNSTASICSADNLFGAGWEARGWRIGFRLYRTLFEDSERSGPIIEE